MLPNPEIEGLVVPMEELDGSDIVGRQRGQDQFQAKFTKGPAVIARFHDSHDIF